MRVASRSWPIAFVLLAAFALGCQHEPLEVARVELSQMAGKWYEIAKLPRPSQLGCVGTTAEYRLESVSELLVVNECREGSLTGPLKRVSARAVANDPSEPGKLSLDFGFAYGDYWVIDAGEQYEYLVVGHPSRDYLWILSRARTLPDATLAGCWIALARRASGRHLELHRPVSFELGERAVRRSPAPSCGFGNCPRRPRASVR